MLVGKRERIKEQHQEEGRNRERERDSKMKNLCVRERGRDAFVRMGMPARVSERERKRGVDCVGI